MSTEKVELSASQQGTPLRIPVLVTAGETCRLDATLPSGAVASHTGPDLPSALNGLREELEAMGILVRCNGARSDVHSSGMTRQAHHGRRAYVLTLPRTQDFPEVVDIFADAPPNAVIANLAEQRAWFATWRSAPLAEIS